MYEPTTIENYKGYVIKIYPDEDPIHPRKDWDNLGNMICFHKRYNLGDKHDISFNDFNSWGELESHLEKELNAVVIFPLYLYDHCGITMKTTPFGDRWDSGQVGFIYATRKDILENFSGPKPRKLLTKKLIERTAAVLQSEVRTYDAYLSGSIYGFVIEKDDEEVESVWGFYPGEDASGKTIWADDEALAEAKSMVDGLIKQLDLPLNNATI